MVYTTVCFKLITINAIGNILIPATENFIQLKFNYNKYLLCTCKPLAAGRLMKTIHMTHRIEVKFKSRTVGPKRPETMTAFSHISGLTQNYHIRPNGFSYLMTEVRGWCEMTQNYREVEAAAQPVCYQTIRRACSSDLTLNQGVNKLRQIVQPTALRRSVREGFKLENGYMETSVMKL